jgi:response regulator RpfG family c-di-GMP phosphodiesterase
MSNMKLLYIDDESKDFEALRTKLANRPVQIVEKGFRDGLSFVEDYRGGGEWSLILVDILNDEGGATVFGIQILESIVANHFWDNVPVCLFSNKVIARSDFADSKLSFKNSGLHYQTYKGFSGNELFSAFQAIVARGRKKLPSAEGTTTSRIGG